MELMESISIVSGGIGEVVLRSISQISWVTATVSLFQIGTADYLLTFLGRESPDAIDYGELERQ